MGGVVKPREASMAVSDRDLANRRMFAADKQAKSGQRQPQQMHQAGQDHTAVADDRDGLIPMALQQRVATAPGPLEHLLWPFTAGRFHGPAQARRPMLRVARFDLFARQAFPLTHSAFSPDWVKRQRQAQGLSDDGRRAGSALQVAGVEMVECSRLEAQSLGQKVGLRMATPAKRWVGLSLPTAKVVPGAAGVTNENQASVHQVVLS